MMTDELKFHKDKIKSTLWVLTNSHSARNARGLPNLRLFQDIQLIGPGQWSIFWHYGSVVCIRNMWVGRPQKVVATNWFCSSSFFLLWPKSPTTCWLFSLIIMSLDLASNKGLASGFLYTFFFCSFPRSAPLPLIWNPLHLYRLC